MKYIWKRCAGACSVFIFFAHASPNRMYTRIVIFVTKQNVMAMSIFTRRFMCKNYDARIRNLITTVTCAVVVKISKNLVNFFFSLPQIFHFKRWNISFFPVTDRAVNTRFRNLITLQNQCTSEFTHVDFLSKTSKEKTRPVIFLCGKKSNAFLSETSARGSSA